MALAGQKGKSMSANEERKTLVVVLKKRGSSGQVAMDVSSFPLTGQTIHVPRNAKVLGKLAHLRGTDVKLLSAAPAPPSTHETHFKAFYV